MNLLNKKVIIFLLLSFLFLGPYISGKYTTLIGFDAGYYVPEINRYMKSDFSLKKDIAVFHEPGGILSGAIFFQITGTRPSPDIRFFISIILILKSATIFLIGKKTLKKDSKIILFVTLFTLSNAYINLFYLFLYRQFFSDFIFLVLTYFLLFKRGKELGYIYVCGILAAGTYISHRGVSTVLIVLLIGLLLFYYKKNSRVEIFQIVLGIGLVAIVLSLPYTVISLPYNWKIIKDIIELTQESSNSPYASGSQGVSIYTGVMDPYGSKPWEVFNTNPLLKMISICILGSIVCWRKKNMKLLMLITSILYIIVATKGPFSQRIFYYLFLTFYLTFLTGRGFRVGKILILILGLITGVSYTMQKAPRIEYNEAIYNFLSQFDKEKSVFYVTGSPGVLIGELGWRTIGNENFANRRFSGDFKNIDDLNADLFFTKGPDFPIINRERDSTIYIIVTKWLMNTQTKYGFISEKQWDGSKYYERVNSPCDKATSRIFCYIYKSKINGLDIPFSEDSKKYNGRSD